MVQQEKKVVKLLKDIGVPPHLSGYEFIKSAVLIALEHPSAVNRITKEIYPEVAKKHKTTAARVERAIRHATEVSVDNMPFDMYEEMFGNTINANKGKPTNSHFIATLVETIKLLGE